MVCYFPPLTKMVIIKESVINCGKGLKKRKPCNQDGGLTLHLRRHTELPLDQGNPLPGVHPKELSSLPAVLPAPFIEEIVPSPMR